MFNLILPLQRFGDNLRNNPIVKYFGTIFVHTHTHLIKYELGGGINHVSNPISYTVASAAITLQEPTRSGYTFAGWEEGEGTIPSGSTEPKTFTAQWSPSVYTVSYTLNGGTNHDGNPASYTVESPAITLQAPTRQGYDFAGWAEEEGKIPAGSTGNKTFTARWLILAGHYSIAYVLGGGENHPDNPGTYTSGDDVITLKNPNRPGYTFEGWLPENTIPAGSTGDKTFAAQWAIIEGHYSITYELGGGENHPDNPGTYTSGDDAITLKDPNREGYTFEGWLPENTIPAGSTGDKSFTAQWAIIEGYYSITYVLDGGENHPDNPGTYTSGDDAITLRDPNRAGYAFEGWLPENTIPSGSTGEKTFTAQWAILTYSIGYELNAGTNHSDNPTGYTVESATVSLQNPYRPGYTFEGWAEGNTIASGSTGDKIFTAQWSPRYYEIKYELGGGTNHPDNPEVYTGIDEITLQNPFREGYTFEGWAEGNTIPAGSTGDRTFTAQWSIITGYYRIVYVLDGGTNHPANPEVYTENDGITLQNPVRTGYTFDGWAEGNTIPAGSTGDKTFTAQWKCSEANIVEITLDGVNITGRENGGVFKYSIDGCDKTSLMLNLNVSPGANVSVNGEAYPSSGYEIVPDGGPASIASVSIRIVSEAGDNAVEYTLRIALPAGGSLYYQRWSDVLAVNVNPETNGGYTVSGVRWYMHDGTSLGYGSYIEIQGSASDYYAEIETEGAWRRVCHTAETRSLDKIAAYPNPVPRGEKLTLKLPEQYAGGVLNIYDIRGALVKSGQPLPVTVNSVDVSELVSGIYLLRVSDKQGKSETVKIIVE